MQIITSRHKCPDEIVPASESESSIRDEVNRRSCKAGYTDRDGQPIRRRSDSGKGDMYRLVDKEKYDKNYARIFGHE